MSGALMINNEFANNMPNIVANNITNETKEVMMRPDSRCASAVSENRLGVNVQENFQVPGTG